LEILGPTTQVDILLDYFTRKLNDVGIFDGEPIKLELPWRNKRVGEERIAK
jgi:hypothetical protein